MSLQQYRRKRDFSVTAEPPPAQPSPGSSGRFVIQKHAASRLHYDFRLELGGVLKSWAVPKGIPLKRGERRLAVHVEDHPVDYLEFEGTIPKGQYGGGTVMVWDIGTYEPVSDQPARDLASGKLHVVLHGRKLKGEWYLVRLRDSDQWLLIRRGDDARPISARQEDRSALSGRTMKQLTTGGPVWNSNRGENGTAAASTPSARRAPATVPKARPKSKRAGRRAPGPAPARARFPGFVEPMKARLMDHAPVGEWSYELKFDGFRALAMIQDREVTLCSRNQKELDRRFPAAVEAVRQLGLVEAILDGELVALDPKGRSSFQLLQAYEQDQSPPLRYFVFDLLWIDGEDLRSAPLNDRRARLQSLIGESDGLVQYSPTLGTDADPLLKQARKLGLEGLIGKRMDSAYESGRRSGAWIKLKLLKGQEFVIGGFTDPEGARSGFGALLVGTYDGRQLRYAGKVGTGFDDAGLRGLHARLKKLERPDPPFTGLPEARRGRFGAGLTAAEMRRCHWVEPTLVAQVRYTEWTRDGKLRHPVFLGLRDDKRATEVVRENS